MRKLMATLRTTWERFYGQAYLLLTLSALMWGGNAVASRLAVGHISPMVLTTVRWAVICVVLGPLMARSIAEHAPALTARWLYIAVMGAMGLTGFNSLMYAAAHHTTAVNISILQGSIPILVLLGAFVWFRAGVRLLQALGMSMTLVGVGAVATAGDPTRLAVLAFNIGDVWMMIACLTWAAYTLALRARPTVPSFVLFTALGASAFVASLPLLAIEFAIGAAVWPDAIGWMILFYVALFPSLLSQIFYMRGIELIGPSRAGLFVNLVPVFGAILAVCLLAEPYHLWHAAGLALVLAGIWLTERR